MKQQTRRRHINDTRTVLSAALKQDNPSGVESVVVLTGKTVKFKMVDAAGAVVIAETDTGVTVESGVDGTVYYDFSAASVDTAGTYYGYFVVYDGTKADHFPVQGRGLKIRIDGDAVTAEEADEA